VPKEKCYEAWKARDKRSLVYTLPESLSKFSTVGQIHFALGKSEKLYCITLLGISTGASDD